MRTQIILVLEGDILEEYHKQLVEIRLSNQDNDEWLNTPLGKLYMKIVNEKHKNYVSCCGK